MDREAAQARLNRIRTFNSELAALEQGGVLTMYEGQRRAIAEYHQRLLGDLTAQFDLDRDEGQQRMSVGMRIASLLGAIALSAAVFLFFYRIWGSLSTTVQVVLLVGAPLASVTLTEIAHRFDRTRHFVFVAAVIACACIVMNVALLRSNMDRDWWPSMHQPMPLHFDGHIRTASDTSSCGGGARVADRRSASKGVDRACRERHDRAADDHTGRACAISRSAVKACAVRLGSGEGAQVHNQSRRRSPPRAVDPRDRSD